MAALTVLNLEGTLDYDGATPTSNAVAFGTTPDTIALTGRELMRLENTATASRTVTITSIADALNRTRDGSVVLGAGVSKVFGPLAKEGWADASSDLSILADATGVVCEIYRIGAGITNASS